MSELRTPLVCLHGLTGSPRNWDSIRESVEDYHRVVTPTIPGHRGGQDFVAREGVSAVTVLADGIEQQLDEAGVGDAHLVGNSLGGWLALELAARGRARSVVCLSPAFGWSKGAHVEAVFRGFELGRRVYRAVGPVGAGVTRSRIARKMLFGRVIHRTDQLTPASAVGIIDDNLACRAFHPLIAAFRTESLPELGQIDVPVTIVWGTEDVLIPESTFGTRFTELVPKAERRSIAGVGHVPMYDDADAVCAEILRVTA